MRPTTVLARAVLAAALATSGWACGYSLAGRGSFLPADIKRIGIPEFANRTTIFNLESQLTQKVRSEFIGRGRYEIVPESTGVDALLTGEVSNASIMPESFTAQQLATRYSLAVTARVELRDLRTNMVLWENPGLVFRQVYDAPNVGGNPTDASAFFAQDMNALDRMSSDFARTIVSAILEAF
jgi:hypothetical protein